MIQYRSVSDRQTDRQTDGTGVNAAGDAGDTSPNILVGLDVNENIVQYYYIL